MRNPVLALAILAFPAAMALAGGGSFSGRNETLAQHCLLRQATFPAPSTPEEARQLKALGKSVTVLQKPCLSPSKDLAALAKAAKLLDAAFPGDGEFGTDMDAALDGHAADHLAQRDRLYPYLADILDGEPRQLKAYAILERSNALDAAADAAATRADRARLLSSAVKTLDAAWKAATGLKGKDLRNLVPASAGSGSASIDGSPLAPDLLLGKYFPEYGFLDFALVEATDLASPPIRLIEVRVRGVQGPGVYNIRVTDLGVSVYLPGAAGIAIDCPTDVNCKGFATESGGTYTGILTVTTLDTDRRLAEGTFSFQAREAAPKTGTRSITGGSFRLGYRLQKQAVKVAIQ